MTISATKGTTTATTLPPTTTDTENENPGKNLLNTLGDILKFAAENSNSKGSELTQKNYAARKFAQQQVSIIEDLRQSNQMIAKGDTTAMGFGSGGFKASAAYNQFSIPLAA